MRMRTSLAATALVAAGVLLGWLAAADRSPTAGAQEKKAEPGAKADPPFTPAQLAKRSLHCRAVEAVIWGMPAVNYQLMYQEMVNKVGGDHN